MGFYQPPKSQKCSRCGGIREEEDSEGFVPWDDGAGEGECALFPLEGAT